MNDIFFSLHIIMHILFYFTILGNFTIDNFRLFYCRLLLTIPYHRLLSTILGYFTIDYFWLFYCKPFLAILGYFTIDYFWFFYCKLLLDILP
jgi:hypothetical protein